MAVEIERTPEGRVPCEVYTRVMGYIRPVSGYNPGKKSEFYGRKYFEENAVDNSEFIKKYSNIQTTK